MTLSKLTLAVATVLGAGATSSAFAIDLYVDVKTKQIYAEPGPNRQLMGSFERVEDAPAKTAEQKNAAEIAAIREEMALKDNQIKALEEHAQEASGPESVHVKLSDGIHFATKDGNFTAGINGRMQVDSQANVNQKLPVDFVTPTGVPSELNDGTTLRRARLGVEGTFFKNTDYKFEYDFTRGNGLNAGGITDAFIRYNFSKPFSVKFGAFKEPFSMEEATSNRYTTFIERNMAVNTLVDNLNTYKVGFGANYAAERWQVGTSLQTEGVGGYNNAYGSNSLTGSTGSAVNTNGGVNRNGGGGDTSWELNARVTGLPWMESKTKFLHVGASGSYITFNNNYKGDGSFNNGGVIFANGIGANVDRTSILNTGNLTSGNIKSAAAIQADYLHRWGAETALVYGPFSVQGEYIQANIHGQGYSRDESLEGYYGYMTYFLTGESRNYKAKTGAWDRIKPNHNFDMHGGWGAWELAAGYDYMDLNSGIINGGRASTAKFGINWYPNSHLRVMANYVHALDIDTGTVTTVPGGTTANATSRAFNNADLDILETRVQVDW
ncbi:OprO/OprP family phosphate-selective porin [Candidatus Methylomicrobium oryzae]|jgi:phosphate-selective porin OprO/OprP|uniref:OprO/OprP family phosphate-selective porin n=1 Tax=Candidatus Methylomicrobium oryzae TaxID=2802053 RepID=UPI001923E17F|nr:porin [Methylomicrobium sp. RS1]MBL1265880.1 porin [Methylomicrobium sp. RS1]